MEFSLKFVVLKKNSFVCVCETNLSLGQSLNPKMPCVCVCVIKNVTKNLSLYYHGEALEVIDNFNNYVS